MFTCFSSEFLIAVQKDIACIFKTFFWALVTSLKGHTSPMRFVLATQSADETCVTLASLKRWKGREKLCIKETIVLGTYISEQIVL